MTNLLSVEGPALYAEYERLRGAGSVVWDDQQGLWLVLGFDECDAVLTDEDLFAHPNRRDLMSDSEWQDVVANVGGERALVLLDAVSHARLHREITTRFAKNLERYRVERVRPVVERFVQGFVSGGSGDFVTEFTDPIPPAVIASVLGLPWDREDLLMQWKSWNQATFTTRNRFDVTEAEISAGRVAALELDGVLRPVVRERREDPRDDFISQLWECLPDILPDCTEDDIIAQCRQLFSAGSETTTHLMTNAGALLFSDPGIWSRLRDRPTEVHRFVEETLRVLGVLQMRPRIATRDVVLGGKSILAGDRLYAMLSAASRDPERFSCPHAINLDSAKPKRHLAFGAGPRVCAGAAVARAEMKEMITALFKSIDNPRLDPARESPSFQGVASMDWRPLHVLFDVRSEVADAGI